MSRKYVLPIRIRAGTALIIFVKMHFLLISENEFFFVFFFHEIKRDGMTSFMDSMSIDSIDGIMCNVTKHGIFSPVFDQ